MNRIKVFAATLFFSLLLSNPSSAIEMNPWEKLLKKYVSPGKIAGIPLNTVEYQALGKDPLYRDLLKKLAAFSPEVLDSSQEKLAFWINVYNILAVKMVIDHHPLGSIKEAGSLFHSVWKKNAGIIGGKTYSLETIEHEILRKMGDPRIHAAIVCASVSCPDLRLEAYRADKIDSQLDDQLSQFLRNPQKGFRVEKKRKRIHFSSIFKWFKEDFRGKGGVRKYLETYVPKDQKDILGNLSYRIAYMAYNWDVNETRK